MPKDLIEEGNQIFDAGRIDVETERSGLLARFAEFLVAKREVRPMMVFYRLDKRILAVTGRPFENETEFYETMQEMLFLLPSLRATTTLIGIPSSVQVESGDMMDAIVTIVLSFNGARSEAHVYTYDEHDEFAWYETELGGDGLLYGKQIEHMLPIFATTSKFPFSSQDVVDFLTSRQYEIEFFDKTYSQLEV